MEDLNMTAVLQTMTLCALAAGSITEGVRRGLNGWLKARGSKPWWKASALRAVAVVCGAGAGLLMFPDAMPTGLLVGIGSANLTTEAIGSVRRFLRAKGAGASGEAADF